MRYYDKEKRYNEVDRSALFTILVFKHIGDTSSQRSDNKMESTNDRYWFVVVT